MATINDYIKEMRKSMERRIDVEKHNYERGKSDCKAGFYDKWYRYNTPHDGRAYDLGWQEQNAETQNETVQFIEYSTNQ